MFRAQVAAADLLLDSEALRFLLKVVLDIGNFLNSHSSRLSSASGYTLDTLLKLPDARSPVDKSVTLLHWLIRHCMSKNPAVRVPFRSPLADCSHCERAEAKTLCFASFAFQALAEILAIDLAEVSLSATTLF